MALGKESATAWPAAADFEELTTTAAPAADSDLATAAPIPLAEPVTIATLPCRLIRLSRRGRLVPGQLSCPYPHQQALTRARQGLRETGNWRAAGGQHHRGGDARILDRGPPVSPECSVMGAVWLRLRAELR